MRDPSNAVEHCTLDIDADGRLNEKVGDLHVIEIESILRREVPVEDPLRSEEGGALVPFPKGLRSGEPCHEQRGSSDSISRVLLH